jgi:uncharacterized membrane protein
MTDLHVLLKLAHVVGACVLLGTGIGIAFFMWMANRSGEAGLIAATARIVVIADTVFTATAVVAQPACWLPVVWVQIKLRDLASAARDAGKPLPAQYHRLFRVWFILGWPAFAGVVAIFALMIAKPTF